MLLTADHEAALLWILLHGDAEHRHGIPKLVGAEHFSNPECRAAYELLCDCTERFGIAWDIRSVKRVCNERGQDGEEIYATLKGELLDDPPVACYWQHHCDELRKRLRKERALQAIETASNDITAGEPIDAARLIADIESTDVSTAMPTERMDDVANEPNSEVTWAIDDVLPTGRFAVWAGKRKNCKTMIAMDAGISIASGRKFLDAWTTGEPAPVLYLATEGDRRQLATYYRRILRSKQLEESGMLFTLSALRLDKLDDVAALRRRIEESKLKVVFIDSLHKCLGGKAEQASNFFVMGNLLSQLEHAAAENDCAVVALHHTRQHTSGTSLNDLAYSGPAETAGAWLLLHQTAYFASTMTHEYDLEIGGRGMRTLSKTLKISELDERERPIWFPEVERRAEPKPKLNNRDAYSSFDRVR